VEQRTSLGQPGVLLATVPRESGRTLYVDLGDTPFVIGACLLLGLAWLLAGARRRRRHHDQWTFPLSRRRADATQPAGPPAKVRSTVDPGTL
jgi:MYXO-CTERM domain-containing protein